MQESQRAGISRRSLIQATLALFTTASCAAPREAVAQGAELADEGSELSGEVAEQAAGRWLKGEYHTHTVLSKDATNPYMAVANNLAAAFRDKEALEVIGEKYADAQIEALADGTSFDYLIFAEHLRRSLDAVEVGGSAKWNTPFYKAVQRQYDFVRNLQQRGAYADKAIAFACEWDMPDMDHAAVLFHANGSDNLPVEKIHEFEWKFAHASGSRPEDGDDPTSMYEDGGSAELAAWGERLGDGDLAHSYEGVSWMARNFPDGFVLINHPSRHGESGAGAVTIEKLRRLNDLAPDLVFGMEGMPGNQMSWNGGRGELPVTYGGCDPMIARTGGVWDALLCEGRRFWNFTNADFHFKTSGTSYASGYWPSEYSCQHTYVMDTGAPVDDLVRALRSGNSFSTYGNIIDALDFTLSNYGNSATMGQELQAVKGTNATITIRFRIPKMNNYRTIGSTNTGIEVCNAPELDHIDLIMGIVTGKVEESAYGSTGNADARIVKTFRSDEFGEMDEDGFHTVTFEHRVEPDATVYFRVRGTSVAAVDENGDPLRDVDPSVGKGGVERFDYINDYNYAHLCFYSNPVFVASVEDSALPALREKLSTAIARGEALLDGDYESASIALLTQVLDEARSVLRDEGATREELAAAVEKVEKAINSLEPLQRPSTGTGDNAGNAAEGTDGADAADGAHAMSGGGGLPQTGDGSTSAMAAVGALGAAALAGAAALGAGSSGHSA